MRNFALVCVGIYTLMSVWVGARLILRGLRNRGVPELLMGMAYFMAPGIGYPLVVVAANQLGTINATLQTLVVADTFREGLAIAGIVLNSPQPATNDPSTDSNADELARRCLPPLLAEVKHGGGLGAAVDWWELAGAVD